MRITRIEPQKKRRGRRNIYADGQFVLGLSDETLLRAGLRTGDEVSADRLAQLMKLEEQQRVRRTALHFLSTRPRTVREVRDRLREAECAEEEIAAVLEDLQKTGLLNDAAFARAYVRDALARRPAGRMLLRQKMLLLGLDRTLVDEALDELLETGNQESAALESARAYLARKPVPRTPEQIQKLRSLAAGHLARRGFPWETITPALRKLLPSAGEAHGDDTDA